MNSDLIDDVRDSLAVVARDVDVPPIDHRAFAAAAGRQRVGDRQRRIGRLAAGIGLVAAATAGIVAIAGSGAAPQSSETAAGPARYQSAGTPTPAALLVGSAEVVRADGHLTETRDVDWSGLGPEDVYRTANGLLVVDARSRPLLITSTEPEGTAGWHLGQPIRLADAVDNLNVSADGRTGAWFALDHGQVRFVLYDFATDTELFSRPMPADDVSETIVAVGHARAIVESGRQVEIWDAQGGQQKVAIAMDDYQSSGDWVGDVLALPAADRSATDVFSLAGPEPALVATVPLASGALSPAADNVVGFTPYGVDGPHTPDQDRRYIEVWSARGDARSTLDGLPTTVHEFAWLDNDTIVLTGGPRGDSWPGELDTYTCELADLTCTRITKDPTDYDDALPMLPSGHTL